jgi:hypothetical protein
MSLEHIEKNLNTNKRTVEDIRKDLEELEEKLKNAEKKNAQNIKTQKEAKTTTILSIIGFLFVCVITLVMLGPIGLAVALLVSVVIFFASTSNKVNIKYPLNTISKYLIHILTMVIIVAATAVLVYALGPFGILAVGSIVGTIFIIYRSRKAKQ